MAASEGAGKQDYDRDRRIVGTFLDKRVERIFSVSGAPSWYRKIDRSSYVRHCGLWSPSDAAIGLDDDLGQTAGGREKRD